MLPRSTFSSRCGTTMLSRISAAILIASIGPASAHEVWADGNPVPSWVRQACCGPDDVHHLRPDQVHRISDDYYMVDGYYRPISVKAVLPSQDGEYWIFYKNNKSGSQTGVFCFFAPLDF